MSSSGELTAGTLIAGRYRVESSLGGEGSGAVYRAVDTHLERAVALRTIAAGADGGDAQQGRGASRLVHANIARVLDFGQDAGAGLSFVVADLGTGGTLAALLAQRGLPPLPLALRMIQETAAGMAAAHHAGLVHGDLHPGVIWLSRDEGRLRVQVLGLGLDPSGGAPPRVSARYASPERLRKSPRLTAAADVFSLGAIAFEVFAGFPDDWNALLLAMARGKAVVAPSPAERRPELPPAVAQAVRRALVADPDARWADAGELAAQLFAERDSTPAEAPAAAAALPAPASRKASSRGPELAKTDLADTLYIPPTEVPTAPAALEPAEPPRAAASPELAATNLPAVIDADASSAIVDEETGDPDGVVSLPVTGGRKLRFGRQASGSRGLIAAGVAVAILLVGGFVVRSVMAGPEVAAADTGPVAPTALAEAVPSDATPAAEPPAPEPVAANEAPVAEPLPPAADPQEERRREAERLRLEEQRRAQQARQDSIRAAGLAAQQAAASQPQQVAAAPPRPVDQQRPTNAPRIEPVVDAPPAAPVARAAADPNRVYGAGEVDQTPTLSNRAQFQSSIQRTYPSVLRNTATWGSAVVSFVVLPDGRVDRGSISVGEVSHPAFRSAAISAVTNARFNPARVAGQPVRSQASVSITWQPPERE